MAYRLSSSLVLGCSLIVGGVNLAASPAWAGFEWVASDSDDQSVITAPIPAPVPVAPPVAVPAKKAAAVSSSSVITSEVISPVIIQGSDMGSLSLPASVAASVSSSSASSAPASVATSTVSSAPSQILSNPSTSSDVAVVSAKGSSLAAGAAPIASAPVQSASISSVPPLSVAPVSVAPVSAAPIPSETSSAPMALTPDATMAASAVPASSNGAVSDIISASPAPVSAAPAPAPISAAPAPAPIATVSAPVSPVSAAPAPAPISAASVAPSSGEALAVPSEKIVHGFATKVPLSVALRQIVPNEFNFSLDRDVAPGTIVSWQGEKPWREVLHSMLASSGLAVKEQGQNVRISRGSGSSSAAAAPSKGLAPLPPAKNVSEHTLQLPQNMSGEQTATVSSASGVSDAPVMFSSDQTPVDQPVIVETWSATRGDTLHKVLEAWAKRAHVEFNWRSEYDYPLQASVSIMGSFEDAVRNILAGFQEAQPQPVAHLYNNKAAGQSVLVVESRGNNYTE